MPSATAKNYLIVGSTSESSFRGLYPTVKTYTNSNTAPYTSYGTFNDQYGNVWNYTATGEVTTTTTTTVNENLPYTDRFEGLYMNAYDSKGRMVLATQHILHQSNRRRYSEYRGLQFRICPDEYQRSRTNVEVVDPNDTCGLTPHQFRSQRLGDWRYCSYESAVLSDLNGRDH